jgi:hypothetical protein
MFKVMKILKPRGFFAVGSGAPGAKFGSVGLGGFAAWDERRLPKIVCPSRAVSVTMSEALEEILVVQRSYVIETLMIRGGAPRPRKYLSTAST